jgi:hypothetical protein
MLLERRFAYAKISFIMDKVDSYFCHFVNLIYVRLPCIEISQAQTEVIVLLDIGTHNEVY